MDKKRKHKGLYAVVAAVVIAAVTFGLSVNPGSTTLAAAVEGYISGVSGTSYEIAWQTENEAEVIVYLDIIKNGQTKNVPINNLRLQKDGDGNWGLMKGTPGPWEPSGENFGVAGVALWGTDLKSSDPLIIGIYVTNHGQTAEDIDIPIIIDGIVIENINLMVDLGTDFVEVPVLVVENYREGEHILEVGKFKFVFWIEEMPAHENLWGFRWDCYKD